MEESPSTSGRTELCNLYCEYPLKLTLHHTLSILCPYLGIDLYIFCYMNEEKHQEKEQGLLVNKNM